MNSERRVQRVRKCLEPIGNSRADWEIICGVASEMGHADRFDYASAEAIWEEVRQVWKAGSGISYARIEEHGLQWPCTDEAHPGTTILHQGRFAIGDRAAFSLIEYRPTEERVSPEYPFLLTTGRALSQFNAGTMTRRTANLRILPTDYLAMHPGDAERLGLAHGQLARVESAYGRATLPVSVDDAILPGALFATFHDPNVFTNRVTSNLRDSVVGTPEYKVTAVKVSPTPSA